MKHPTCLPIDVLLKDCDLDFYRGSGPGGQHRNKVETGVRITHRPSGVVASAGERRSQSENRREAIQRLRIRLAIELRSETADSADIVTAWISKGKIRIAESNPEWPAFLTQLLDSLAVNSWDPKRVAEPLQTTPSQILRILKQEPQAWARFTQLRQSLST
jgi:hypothetical protein